MILKGNGEDPLLSDLPKQVLNATIRKIQHIAHAEKGPAALPSNRNHPLHSPDGIWQLSAQHPYRLPYFYLPGRVVVITHVLVKHGGQKHQTPAEEIAKARRLKQEFDAAKRAGQVQFEG